MKRLILPLCLFAFSPSAMAQGAGEVTLRFLSFPKSAEPRTVELLVGDGETLEVKTPSNALSPPYKVRRLSEWVVGKTQTAVKPGDPPSFEKYGSAPAPASPDQIILLIRNGRANDDGMRVVPIDNTTGSFGGGEFFFLNASKVDIAGVLGGTKFALKPGTHTIIEPKEMSQREGAGPNRFFTEFFFRKESEARPFFSSSWPANDKARSMVFFYHDTHNERLRMHTIRDYIP